MLKLEDFKEYSVRNLNNLIGGATTIYISGSASGGGKTSHDFQLDGDSTKHACGVDDNATWGSIQWQD